MFLELRQSPKTISLKDFSGGKLWTYTYANNSKAQIDYVFIDKSVGHGYLSMAVLFSSIEATLIEEQQ